MNKVLLMRTQKKKFYEIQTNKQTEEEHICDKVTIDGFDYYVSDGEIKLNDPIADKYKVWFWRDDCSLLGRKKVIATNNPNIDIPKVENEVEELAHTYFAEERFNWEKENPNGMKSPQSLIEHYNKTFTPIYKAGYNKSQETHPFSEEDMIEFAEFVAKYTDKNKNHKGEVLHAKSKYDGAERTTDLLQLWKEQRPKIVYYNG